MDACIAWSGDYIERLVGDKALHDDVEGLRKLNGRIEAGNAIVKSWVELAGGAMISVTGGEGRATVPAGKLADLARIREQVGSAYESPVSVGVGMKLGEAERALKVTKLQGGNQIRFYSPQVDEELEHERERQNPDDKLVALGKSMAEGRFPADFPGEIPGVYWRLQWADNPLSYDYRSDHEDATSCCRSVAHLGSWSHESKDVPKGEVEIVAFSGDYAGMNADGSLLVHPKREFLRLRHNDFTHDLFLRKQPNISTTRDLLDVGFTSMPTKEVRMLEPGRRMMRKDEEDGSRQAKWLKERASEGFCSRCGARKAVDGEQCSQCATGKRETYKENRNEGLCSCGRARAKGKKSCQRCIDNSTLSKIESYSIPPEQIPRYVYHTPTCLKDLPSIRREGLVPGAGRWSWGWTEQPGVYFMKESRGGYSHSKNGHATLRVDTSKLDKGKFLADEDDIEFGAEPGEESNLVYMGSVPKEAIELNPAHGPLPKTCECDACRRLAEERESAKEAAAQLRRQRQEGEKKYGKLSLEDLMKNPARHHFQSPHYSGMQDTPPNARCRSCGKSYKAHPRILSAEDGDALRYFENKMKKSNPAMNAGSGGGFSGAHPAQGAAAPVAPSPEASEHSETESFLSMLNDPDRPQAPEGTHAARDLEDHFHSLAQQQGVKDDQDRQVSEANLDKIKGQVAQALQSFRAQMPAMEQIKQGNPELYQSMVGLVQAVVTLGREITTSGGEQPTKKAEEIEDPDFEPLSKAVKVKAPKPTFLVHFGKTAGLKTVDLKHMGQGAPSQEYRQGIPKTKRAYYYIEGGQPEPLVTSGSPAKYVGVLPPSHQIYDLAEDSAGIIPKARKAFMDGRGAESPTETILAHVKRAGYCGYRNTASSMPHVVALFHDLPVTQVPMDGTTKVPEAVRGKLVAPQEHVARKDEKREIEPHEAPPKEKTLDKATLPMPKPKGPATPKVETPIGGSLAPRRSGAADSPRAATSVKVQHADGSTSVKEVLSGMIRSQDPTGHPTSSREPNAR